MRVHHKSLMYFMNQKLAQGFQGWRKWLHNLKNQRDAMISKPSRMHGSPGTTGQLRHTHNLFCQEQFGICRVGSCQWHGDSGTFSHEQCRESEAILRRGLMALFHRQRKMAWNQWCTVTLEMNRLRAATRSLEM